MITHQYEIVAGLDMGTTVIRVAIGKCCDGKIEIIGVGQAPSQGMRKSTVINLESTAAAIRGAVKEAELMAGCKIKSAVVGIADMSICCHNSSAGIRIKHGIVSKEDIRQAIESAEGVPLPPGHRIIHITPYEFIIDKKTKTTTPFGMSGSLLEAKAKIITIASDNIKNIADACKLAGVKKINVVLQSLATAETVLTPEELRQGVLLIDFGGGRVKIALFSNSAMKQYSSSWLSGNKLTEDVAVGLRIPMIQAEQLKRLHGCCLENMVDSEEMIEIDLLKDNRKKLFPRQHLVEIIGGRTDELFTLISGAMQIMERNGEPVGAAVITGGNSLLPGIKEQASQRFNIPVRIGMPRTVNGLVDSISQLHDSTAVGLVLLGARKSIHNGIKSEGDHILILRMNQMFQRVLRYFI